MHTRPVLTDTLTASLLDSASQFKPEDLQRHVNVAFAELCRFSPRVVFAELELVAGQGQYPCPAALSGVLSHDWGRDAKASLQPWSDGWPGELPVMQVGFDGDGARVLQLRPTPSSRQIGLLGSRMPYRYSSRHILTDSASSLSDEDAQLLILRAQAEAMRELAMHHASKPFQLRDGISSTPRNGMPGYLYSVLMAEFEQRVKA